MDTKPLRGPPSPQWSGRRGLWLGVLAYRWVAFAWMTLLAISANDFRRPVLAWTAIGGTGLWTVWLSVTGRWDRPTTRWLDLGVCVSLLLVSGAVMPEGYVLGPHPFFATAYPVCAALTWGAAKGVGAGVASGVVLSIALALSRSINGVYPGDATQEQLEGLGNGMVYYLAAGGAMGLISRVLGHADEELQRAQEKTLREQERAARLAERDVIGRQIHDSVLQALALVNKRGHELATAPSVPGSDVLALAEVAAEQERTLRALIQHEPEEAPTGRASLRQALDSLARSVRQVPVTVTAVGPIWLPAREVEEVVAAIRQALDNVVLHARATQAIVFAEEEDQGVLVTVRDDGVGFVYDPDRLRSEGKLGLLGSMKGRIEDLGGQMTVHTAQGAGTEVEFLIPSPEADGPIANGATAQTAGVPTK